MTTFRLGLVAEEAGATTAADEDATDTRDAPTVATLGSLFWCAANTAAAAAVSWATSACTPT